MHVAGASLCYPVRVGSPPSLRSVDLNLLLVLESLLETRSVARTGAALSLSPSAVSHALARLRSALQDQLFVRGAKGLVPTPRALELAVPLGQALRQLGAAFTRDRAFDPRSLSRTFLIATADYGAGLLLPALLARLSEVAPGVQIVVRPLPVDAEHALESGEADAMIGIYERQSPFLYRRRLFTERFRCMTRAGHPAVKDGRLSLEDFLAHGHILIAPRGKPGSRLDSQLAERGLSRRVAAMIPEFLVGPFLVARTDLLLSAGDRFLSSFDGVLPVSVVDLPFELPPFDVSLVWHARVHEDPAHRWLRELLFELHDELYQAAPERPRGAARARPGGRGGTTARR